MFEIRFLGRAGRISAALSAVVLFVAVCANAQPEKLSKSFAEIAKKVEPAVVSIDTKVNAPQSTAKVTPSPEKDDDIMEFLRRQMAQRPVYGVGSGFIVDKAGYILTNAHVIDGASRITVKLDSGEEYPGTVLGSDDETDAHVVLVADAPTRLTASGHSDRSPDDLVTPEIGEEVAVARALRRLADQLLETAAGDIEDRTGEHDVTLRPR